MNSPISKPLRFYATAAFRDRYLHLLADVTIVVRAHFRDRPMDLYIFESGAPGFINVRVNGYQLGQANAKEESFKLPAIQGPEVNTFWCKIEEHEDELVALFLFPSDY